MRWCSIIWVRPQIATARSQPEAPRSLDKGIECSVRARQRIARRRGTKKFRASDPNGTPTGHSGTLIAKLLISWRSLGDSNPCFRRERAKSKRLATPAALLQTFRLKQQAKPGDLLQRGQVIAGSEPPTHKQGRRPRVR